MAEVPIPPVLPGPWRGVIVEQHDTAGEPLWTVTIRAGLGRGSRRRWFPDHALALAHGAQLADRQRLPLFDLGAEG